MDGGAWWAAVHGVAEGWTRLSSFHFHFHFSLSCTGEGNGTPLQCSCLENPRDGGVWWAAVYGVAQSRTRLKRQQQQQTLNGLPQWLTGKESACNAGDAGDLGSIPGLRRSPGGGHGNPLPHSCLGNPMDRGAWRATVQRVAKSLT